jgi:hypothetical protein
MTRAEFDSIVRDVAKTVFPKTSRGVMNEFLFMLNEELVANGLDLEDFVDGGEDNDVRDDDDEDEE